METDWHVTVEKAGFVNIIGRLVMSGARDAPLRMPGCSSFSTFVELAGMVWLSTYILRREIEAILVRKCHKLV